MVDEEVVATKLRQAHEYTNDLEEMRGISKAEYVSDVVIQRAVERTLMNLIQARIDLAQHVRAMNGLSSGGRRKTRFRRWESWASFLRTRGRESRRPSASETSSHTGTGRSTTR